MSNIRRWMRPRTVVWAGVILLLWFFRTWFHTPILWGYTHPVLLEAILIWWILHRFILRRWGALTRVREWVVAGQPSQPSSVTRVRFLWPASATVFILLAIFSLIAAGWAQGAYLARTLAYRSISTLPESRESVRLMPLEVATRYAKDSLQFSQFTLGREALIAHNGRLHWSYPLVPSSLLIKFTRQSMGLALVDATAQRKNTDIVEKPLTVGEGMHLTDNLWWRVYRKRYFIKAEKPFYSTQGDLWTAVPVIDYSYRLWWGLLYTVPRFEGIYLVDSAGRIQFLTPKQAAAHPALANTRIFPEGLARQYVDAHQYHLGIANKLFVHRNQSRYKT